jgi:hypothetical protein
MCREAGAARPCEGIEHDVSRIRKRFNEWQQTTHRFFVRVMNIPGVFPGKNILRRMWGFPRPSFRKKVGDFMMAARISFSRAVRFLTNDMAHGAKAAVLPDSHESVYPWPAVKRNAESVGFQNPIDFPKGGYEPVSGIVIRTPAAVTRVVIDKIGWVSKNQINAAIRQRRHDFYAVPLDDFVYERFDQVHWILPYRI